MRVGSPNGRRRGFTLVELLVVIAIIGILVSLLLPAVQAAREAARRMKCSNNLKQYGLALHNYHDTFNSLPPGGVWNTQSADWNVRNMSWHARVLPYIEQQTIYDKINWTTSNAPIPGGGAIGGNVGWDSIADPSGRRIRQTPLPYANCPSDETGPLDIDTNWAQTSYCGSLGSQWCGSANGSCNIFATGGVHHEALPWNAEHGNTWRKQDLSGIFCRMGTDGRMNLSAILDGTSNVIMVGEILPACHDHTAGMWHYNGMGNAHASTSVPINTLTTCATNQQDATNRRYPFPQCFAKSNWNLSWGFRSRHKAGAQFVFVDGSVQFLTSTMDYATYQYLGGRADGRPVGQF